MNAETKTILTRWHALKNGDGLPKVKRVQSILYILGFGLVLLVVASVYYKYHPVFLAMCAIASGWVIAESNALKLRASQWPLIKQYIDWERVERDLNEQSGAA